MNTEKTEPKGPQQTHHALNKDLKDRALQSKAQQDSSVQTNSTWAVL